MRLAPRFVAAVAAGLFCAPLAAQSVSMARSVAYAADADVPRKVRDECTQLNTQLADYTVEFGREFGVTVSLVEAPDPAAGGRVLLVEIVNAISQGNPFIGHAKMTGIKGQLFEDGQPVASFRARRNSGGGAFGGYKGSCSVLGRTVKALGKDVAMWLKSPQDGAELGDY